jgi:ankyrin repeat protein
MALAFLRKSVSFYDRWTRCCEIIAQGDEPEEISGLLERDANLSSERNSKGDTLLHIAVLYGRIQTMSILAQHCDIDATDRYGDSPLNWAVLYTPESKKLECIMFLIYHGAKMDLGERTPLASAVIKGDTALVELFVAKGSNVIAKSHYGGRSLTAREIAIDKGYSNIASILQFSEKMRFQRSLQP